MGYYRDRVLPRLVDLALDRRDVKVQRARALGGLSGAVLEIGFGSGLNLPHYPEAVRRVIAVDPAIVGHPAAARRIAATTFPLVRLRASAGALPLADASVDAAVSTFTLCTVADPARVLAEIRRALRPGGSLHFLEHGLAPDPGVARWQRRLGPLQRLLAGGCELDRGLDRLIASAGFTLTRIERGYLGRPRVLTFLYRGVAVAR